MIITREWAMPNKDTFSIKPIRNLIDRYITDARLKGDKFWIDPFARNSPFKDYCITNDLSPDFETDYHEEALDFLKRFEDNSVDGVLFDVPYTPRQISECYKGVGRAVHKEDTQSSFYGDRKNEVARIIKNNGIVISFGFNSSGIGKKNGGEIIEILLVAHGGAHHDTIVTVDKVHK